jgi:hypothetical protein
VEVKDPILGIEVYRLSELVVCRLLFLGANKCFLIDALMDVGMGYAEENVGEGFFMECLWDLDFL